MAAAAAPAGGTAGAGLPAPAFSKALTETRRSSGFNGQVSQSSRVRRAVDRLTRLFKALEARDGDAYAELCSEDVEVTVPEVGVSLKGRDAVRRVVNESRSRHVHVVSVTVSTQEQYSLNAFKVDVSDRSMEYVDVCGNVLVLAMRSGRVFEMAKFRSLWARPAPKVAAGAAAEERSSLKSHWLLRKYVHIGRMVNAGAEEFAATPVRRTLPLAKHSITDAKKFDVLQLSRTALKMMNDGHLHHFRPLAAPAFSAVVPSMGLGEVMNLESFLNAMAKWRSEDGGIHVYSAESVVALDTCCTRIEVDVTGVVYNRRTMRLMRTTLTKLRWLDSLSQCERKEAARDDAGPASLRRWAMSSSRHVGEDHFRGWRLLQLSQQDLTTEDREGTDISLEDEEVSVRTVGNRMNLPSGAMDQPLALDWHDRAAIETLSNTLYMCWQECCVEGYCKLLTPDVTFHIPALGFDVVELEGEEAFAMCRRSMENTKRTGVQEFFQISGVTVTGSRAYGAAAHHTLIKRRLSEKGRPYEFDYVTHYFRYLPDKHEWRLSRWVESMQSVGSDSLQGWIWKRGQRVQNWKRRWMHVDGGCIRYFEDEAKRVEKGSVALLLGTTVRFDPSTLHDGHPCVVVSTPERSDFVFHGESQEKTVRWVANIRANVQST